MGKKRRAVSVETEFRRQWKTINGAGLNLSSFAVDLKTAKSQAQIIMANEMPPDIKQFKVSIFSLFLFLTEGVFTSAVISFFIFGRTDLHRFLDAIEIAMPFLLLLVIIMTSLLYVVTKPIGFSPDGIYASSQWGFRRFIHWSEIAKVQKNRLLNLKFLKIYSSIDGKVTRLLLFQVQKKEFRDEIRKFAPPDSPILNFLNWF